MCRWKTGNANTKNYFAVYLENFSKKLLQFTLSKQVLSVSISALLADHWEERDGKGKTKEYWEMVKIQ